MEIVINIDDEFLQELRPTGYTQQDVVALGMIAIKLAEIDTMDEIRVLEGMEYDEKAVIVRLIEEINALRSRDTERIMFELQKNSQWQSQ